MRRLQARPRVDRLRSETRPRKGRLARWIYLTLLAVLVVWLLDTFLGDYVLLRAPGLVMRERAAVDARFDGWIVGLEVREGDRVQVGQVVASVDSLTVRERLADLANDAAGLRADIADLGRRRLVLKETVPLAEQRSDAYRSLAESRESLYRRGLATKDDFLENQVDLTESAIAGRRMRAELTAIEAEIAALGPVVADVERALADLRLAFDDGRLRAPVTGIVTRRPVSLGSVVAMDETLMTIHYGPTFVLAYLPPGRLYDVAVGQSVTVSFGVRDLPGRIADILPFSDAMPPEFQRAFRPTTRAQVLRVKLEAPPGDLPPVLTKVEIGGPGVFGHLIGWMEGS